MSNRILNCAVIGLGIGEQHAKALLSHPQIKLNAICDVDNDKIQHVLTKYSLKNNIVKSFSDIVNDNETDLVSIASFDDDHYEQVMACLNRGKHVFVEKPLCQTPTQLREIYTLWKKSGLALSSNLILRKAPLYVWLKKVIDSGELGDIYSLDMDYLYGRVHKITEGWRAKVENYSVMEGGGIHMVDLMMLFVGQKPINVQSCVNKIATQHTAFRYHDFHAATFHFQNGAIGRIAANFACTHRHQHVIRIFGTNATFIYDDMGARIHKTRDEAAQAEAITLAPKPKEKGDLLLEFADSILKNTYKDNAQVEFDLMCAVAAADRAIGHNGLINIQYLT